MERVNQHIADINSKTIFKNDILCAQFIRDNIDIPILKNVQPEDIEDVTDRFTSYFGVEYNADTVKRITIHIDDEVESFYLVSLIDHKSDVDYNVSMQLLKYMACIWAEYEKTLCEKSGKMVKNKSFRYPPIIPVVYYEGEKEWTADIHLRDRVMFSDILRPYIPDFKYILVRNHDFTDEELLSREDEMSLLMLINKFQTAEDISNFKQISSEKIDSIIRDSPEQVIDIIAAVVYSLCSKIHISAEETDAAVLKVREHKLGYLFENMEKIDIQELRRAAEEERKKVEDLKKISEAEREKAEAEREKAEAEQARFKKASLASFKLYFAGIDVDFSKLQSVIDGQTDSEIIVSWLDKMEETTDKISLYSEIIENN